MPKIPIDYTNTIIYKLVHKEDYDNILVYIGHTTDFIKRKYSHKYDCRSKNLKLYEIINEYDGWDNWEMIKVEDYPCKDKYEALERERYWKDYYDAVLNTNNIGVDRVKQARQYYKDNRDKLLEKKKLYYQENKQRERDKKKEYYYKNIDCCKEKMKIKTTCEKCGFVGRKNHLKRHQAGSNCSN